MSLRRIDIDDPDVDMDDGERLYYRGEPFTGEVVEYQRGAMVSLITYADGFEDGPSQAWYVDGTLRSEGAMSQGLPIGESRVWHPNGVLATRVVTADGGQRELLRYEWDDEGIRSSSGLP